MYSIVTSKPSKPLAAPKLTHARAKEIGWRILAGSMNPRMSADLSVAHSILHHIESTGGRAALVFSPCGAYYEIWRPASEMENVEQTEERLLRLSLNHV